jgi:hypothetical protein
MPAKADRLVILRLLAAARPYALPQDTLHLQVNTLVRPPLEASDLMKHLSWLLDRQLVGFVPDPLDPDRTAARKWHIREAGLAALAD